MSWTQVTSQRFERLLDATDLFLKAVCLSKGSDGRDHWTVNAIARLQWESPRNPEDMADRLKRAWVQTRYQHPTIAVVLEDDKFSYEVADETILAEWLTASVFLEHGTIDEFLANVKPQRYCSIHYFLNTSELIVRAHHWIVDGTGALNLLHHVLLNLSTDLPKPVFGNEAERLTPGFTEAAGFPSEPSSSAGEQGQKLFFDFIGNLPSITLPCKSPLHGTEATKRTVHSFGSSTLNELVLACRNRKITVASAVHAAITVAVQDMKAPFVATKNYTSILAYNYRPYLPQPYNNAEEWPIGCYMLGLPFTRPQTDFDTHATEFQKLYHRPLRRENFSFFEGYNTYAGMIAAALSQPPPSGSPPANQPQLSSLGIMDTRVKAHYPGKSSFGVSYLEVAVDMMTTGLVVYQWSWQGRFFLSINYNEAFSQGSLAQEFLARTEEVLFTELGVKAELV